ncbi:LamG domain-containing protein [Streptomyces sp. NPDC059943]|uniref:LamG domain-containing protein n=1 Tax=Streptomyces sp. NPDC059943 TaxID=3347010 RepID=UPI003667B080
MTTLVALIVGLLPQVAVAGEASANAELSASERAARSGEAVEVVSERTEYSSTLANPDGTFTLTRSTAPQRVRKADGSWGSVDATLERRSDGSVGPKGAVVDLAFSGGGSGNDLIRLGDERGSLSLGWANSLPAPTLQGATATYAEVFPGVDLQLTATAEGFREVLVVKSAEAAASAELEQIELTTSGQGLTVRPGAGGGLQAHDEDGNVVFSGPAGQMWDSAGQDTEDLPEQRLHAAREALGPVAAEDETAHPGKGDASAILPVRVDESAVAVEPDLDLLRGENTVYPVYIDPPIGLGDSERSVISSDGDRFWQFDGEYGVGRCATAAPYYCTLGASYTNRMLFEFSPANLAGKRVLDATFRARETWSFDCNPHWVDLERTNNMTSATRWPGPKQLDQMGDRNVSAGRGAACDPDQPDAWIEFNDNSSESDENLTSTVRAFADGKFPRLTLMLRAKDEGDASAWKRFDDNAELQVIYVPKPGVPTSTGLIPGNGTVSYCATSAASPTVATRADPIVQARTQTLVQPKGSDFTGALRTTFLIERQQTDNTWVGNWSTVTPSTGFRPDDHLEKVRLPARSDGTLYRMKARTESFWTTGGVTSSVSSPYARYCYFRIDSKAPSAPQITAQGPYMGCVECVGEGMPGKPGTFTFKPDPSDTDIKNYQWRLLTMPAGETRQVTGATAVVKDVTPTLAGEQVLSVRAGDLDADGRVRFGPWAEFAFKVAAPEGPVGLWHFDDAGPGSTVVTAKDSATAGVRHHATLRPPNTAGKGAFWSVKGRRGTGDYSLGLNDDSGEAQETAYASTAGPAVNTKDSFTLSAWALLTDTQKSGTVASAPGAFGSAFQLYYSGTTKKWVFARVAADVASPVMVQSPAVASNPPGEVWTHLTGVFDTHDDTDKTNDTIQLFVNGRPQGSPVRLSAANPAYTPVTSTKDMLIGRSPAGEYFSGRLDELTLWQSALTPDMVRQDSAALSPEGVPATELVGYWDTASAAGGRVEEWTDYTSPAMTISATGAVPRPEENELDLDGVAGYLTTNGPAVDETGSFTVTADVQVDKALMEAKPIGYQGQVFSQATSKGSESSWALWVEKIDPDGDGVASYYWKFGRTGTDANGAVTGQAQVVSEFEAELDTWVQVTGVYDAGEAVDTGFGTTRLYVSQSEQPSADDASFVTPVQGSGALSWGRGSSGGKTGHYLPGVLDEVRVWTGAMTADQVSTKVMGDPGAE